MKKIWLLLLLIVSISGVLTAQSVNFPDDFLGTYAGKLQIFGAKIQEIDMKFELQKTDTAGKYIYTLIYIAPNRTDERKYFLIEKDKTKGFYQVDEDNGILLNARFVGNSLISIFEVEGNVIYSCFKFENQNLTFEIISSNKANIEKSGGTSTEIPEVLAYPVSGYQKAVLKKE